MKLKKLFPLAGLALIFMAQSTFAAPLEMSFQSVWNPAQKQNADALEPWASSFEERSDGDMKVNLFYVGGLVEANSVIDGVRSGMLDMTAWNALDYNLHPYLYMFAMPYLIDSPDHGMRVWQKLMEEVPGFDTDINEPGLLLSAGVSAPWAIASLNIPVRSPSDMKGKRVLSIAGVFGDYIESWGGIPVSVTMGDVYTGLQRGMGEMFVCGISCVKGSRVHEFAEYITLPGMTSAGMFPYAINRELYEDMTDEQRAILHELSDPLGQAVVDSFSKDFDVSVEEFKAAGVEVIIPTPEEQLVFANAAKDTLETLWVPRMEEAGIENPMELIEQFYEIADSVR